MRFCSGMCEKDHCQDEKRIANLVQRLMGCRQRGFMAI